MRAAYGTVTRVRECVVCAATLSPFAVSRRQSRCPDHRSLRVQPEGALSHSSRYADDADAQEFVRAHPGGATLEEVGQALGLTRERVRQIEHIAIVRLRVRMALAGVSESDVLAMLSGNVDDNDRSLVG